MRTALSSLLILAATTVASAQDLPFTDVSNFQEFVSAMRNNQNIRLTADIYLTSRESIEAFDDYIGGIFDDDPYVNATFDGNGHTIYDMTYKGTDKNIGLFRVAEGCTFRNVKFEAPDINNDNGVVGTLCGTADRCHFENVKVTNANIDGKTGTGGICGTAYNTTFSHCTYHGDIFGHGDHVGGIVGYGEDCTFDDCSLNGNISAGTRTGGIVGELVRGSLQGCSSYSFYIKANVPASYDSYAGGIVGWGSKVSIKECVNHAPVEGKGNNVGGIIGDLEEGDITGCTNFGRVTNTGALYDNCVGGIAGTLRGDISCCTNQGAVAGDNYVGGLVGDFLPVVTDQFLVWKSYRETYMLNCANLGTVYGTDNNVGGLVGKLDEESHIRECLSICSVRKHNEDCNNWGAGCTNGEVHDCYFRMDAGAHNFEAADVESGRLTWLLNDGQTHSDCVWRQNVDAPFRSVDPAPVICSTESARADHGIVHIVTNSDGSPTFTNVQPLFEADAAPAATRSSRMIYKNGRFIIEQGDTSYDFQSGK